MINDENTISEEILYYITNNDFKIGDKLPSERFFSELFSVTRFSLRKALKLLVNNGYLEVKNKSGYYYCGNQKTKININDALSFLKDKESDCHILIFRKTVASKKIAKRMNIEESSQVVQSILLYNYTSEHTVILNVYLYADSSEINRQNINETITTIFENSEEKKGKIYIRDCNDFESQLIELKENEVICRWISNYEFSEYKLYIEQTLNIMPYEFYGW